MVLKRQARPITLRHLLSHTSGLPFLTPMLEADLASMPLDQQVLSFTMNPLEFQPGEGYRYSNQGINTIGRVIEIASGMPYEAFLLQRVLVPLGMRDTTFFRRRSRSAGWRRRTDRTSRAADCTRSPCRSCVRLLTGRDVLRSRAAGPVLDRPDLARFARCC
jgi:CubicO group peptidase (beta-lactamase class C family)